MGIYLNPFNTKYEEVVNSEILIDKTRLIQYINDVLHTTPKIYLCQPPSTIWQIYIRGCNS